MQDKYSIAEGWQGKFAWHWFAGHGIFKFHVLKIGPRSLPLPAAVALAASVRATRPASAADMHSCGRPGKLTYFVAHMGCR